MLDAGESRAAIAENIGLTRIAFDRYAKRLGIDLSRSPKGGVKSIRAQVQDMPASDAAEHLLYLLEMLLGTPLEIEEAKRRLNVPVQAAKLYVALCKAYPKTLTYEVLAQAIAVSPADPGSLNVLHVVMVKLRRTLPPGETIVTSPTIGYRLERKAP